MVSVVVEAGDGLEQVVPPLEGPLFYCCARSSATISVSWSLMLT